MRRSRNFSKSCKAKNFVARQGSCKADRRLLATASEVLRLEKPQDEVEVEKIMLYVELLTPALC